MRSCLITALAWWLVATPAWAQESLEARTRQAAAAYQRGTAHFQAEEYDQALAEYQRAYQLRPVPLLLFNIGLAHRARGDEAEALDAFRRYLEAEPEGEVSAEAREYVAELERAERQRREAAEAAEAARAAQAAQEDRARAGRNLRITGLAVTAGGALLWGTSIVFGLRARGISDDLSNHEGPWTDADLARIDDGEAAERNALILGAVGTAAAIAGGVLFWIGHSRERQAQGAATAIVPAGLGTGDLGLAVTGRF